MPHRAPKLAYLRHRLVKPFHFKLLIVLFLQRAHQYMTHWWSPFMLGVRYPPPCCRESDGWSVICKFLDCNAIRLIKVVHTWYLRAFITNPIIGQTTSSGPLSPIHRMCWCYHMTKRAKHKQGIEKGNIYPNSWTIFILSYPNSSEGAITNIVGRSIINQINK